MLLIQKICAVLVIPLAMACGLVIDLSPWAAILCLMFAALCAWIGAIDIPAPPVHQRSAKIYKWRDSDFMR